VLLLGLDAAGKTSTPSTCLHSQFVIICSFSYRVAIHRPPFLFVTKTLRQPYYNL
jgi:hypothetical protein